MSSASDITVATLLPDLLGTYSDIGNGQVLAQRLRWRGHRVRLLEIRRSDPFPESCEIYLLGGGEDVAQTTALAWLRRRRGLAALLSERSVTLAVCAGLQLLGTSMTDSDGTHHAGLGVLDLTTRPAPHRIVGEARIACALPGVDTLVGFHNHRGATTLGPGTPELGTTLAGPGNHPDHRVEGARTPDTRGPGVVATYLHGPVLARNPTLADHLIGRVLGAPPEPLDPALVPDLPALRTTYLP